MKTLHLVMSLLVLVILIACVPSKVTNTVSQVEHPDEPHQFDHADFAFAYPAAWQLMSELWPNYQNGKDYKNLGAIEVVTVTSVQNQGESGAWCAIATTSLSASDLKILVERTYAETIPAVENMTQSEVTIGDRTGLELRYKRPWGEPWWQFRDIWLEKDDSVYLLSCEAIALDPYQADMDTIFNSFTLK